MMNLVRYASMSGGRTLLGLLFSFLATGAGHAARQTPPEQTTTSAGSAQSFHPPPSVEAMSSQLEDQSHPLHLLVGHSTFIKTLTRLKRVYVSDPLVLDSFASSPTQIVITAKTPGVASLILWDESGQSQVYLVYSDTDIANLQNEIHNALPNDNIHVNTQQDRITLSGTASDITSSEAAVKLATQYGKTIVNSVLVLPPHLRQVRLKVQIVEIDRTKLETFGINFLSQGKNTSAIQTGQFPGVGITTQTATTGTSTPPSLTVTNPLNLLYYSSSLNIGLILQDLQNKQLAQILAEPTITTISGEKASFLSGGEFPYPVVQASSGGLSSITIQFRPYGVKLDFTPIVNADGTIKLKVAPEVSALDFSNAVTISGYTIPAISTRHAETQVELRDGQTFAISGLLDHRTIDLYNKMPGIGDIPVLGKLFRSKSTNLSTVELVVLVTPTILDPITDMTSPVLPVFPQPMLDPSNFDNSIPKNKPVNPPSPPTGVRP
jgi:pilus assembly protein CpaC